MQGVLNRYKRGIINININAGGVVVIDFHPNCVIIVCCDGIVSLFYPVTSITNGVHENMVQHPSNNISIAIPNM